MTTPSGPISVKFTQEGADPVTRAVQELGNQLRGLRTESQRGASASQLLTKGLTEAGRAAAQAAEGTRKWEDGLRRLREQASAPEAVNQATRRATESATLMTRATSALLQIVGARAIARFAQDSLEAAANLADLSTKTGVGTEALSVLGLAAKTANVSQEELEIGLRQLGKSVTQLRAGVPQAAADFKALGLSAKSFDGLSLDQILVKLADRFARFPDGPTKSALALEIFGKNGTELLPLLKDLANGGFEQLRQKAEALHLVVDQKTARSAKELEDRLAELKATAGGLALEFASTLIPGLTATTRAIASMLGSLPSGARTAITSIVAVTAAVAGLRATLLLLGAGALIPGGPVLLGLAALAGLLLAVAANAKQAEAELRKTFATATDAALAAEIAKASSDLAHRIRERDAARAAPANQGSLAAAGKGVGPLPSSVLTQDAENAVKGAEERLRVLTAILAERQKLAADLRKQLDTAFAAGGERPEKIDPFEKALVEAQAEEAKKILEANAKQRVAALAEQQEALRQQLIEVLRQRGGFLDFPDLLTRGRPGVNTFGLSEPFKVDALKELEGLANLPPTQAAAELEVLRQLAAAQQQVIDGNQNIGQSLREGISGELAQFFSDGIIQAQNFGQAISAMASAIVGSIRRIVAELLAAQIVQGIASFLGFGGIPAAPKDTIAVGPVLGRQTGGWIPGSGSGDIVPMLGEPGEFVLSRGGVRTVAQAMGPGWLELANEGLIMPPIRLPMLPHFESGGPVGAGLPLLAASGATRATIDGHVRVSASRGLILEVLEGEFLRIAGQNRRDLKDLVQDSGF